MTGSPVMGPGEDEGHAPDVPPDPLESLDALRRFVTQWSSPDEGVPVVTEPEPVVTGEPEPERQPEPEPMVTGEPQPTLVADPPVVDEPEADEPGQPEPFRSGPSVEPEPWAVDAVAAVDPESDVVPSFLLAPETETEAPAKVQGEVSASAEGAVDVDVPAEPEPPAPVPLAPEDRVEPGTELVLAPERYPEPIPSTDVVPVPGTDVVAVPETASEVVAVPETASEMVAVPETASEVVAVPETALDEPVPWLAVAPAPAADDTPPFGTPGEHEPRLDEPSTMPTPVTILGSVEQVRTEGAPEPFASEPVAAEPFVPVERLDLEAAPVQPRGGQPAANVPDLAHGGAEAALERAEIPARSPGQSDSDAEQRRRNLHVVPPLRAQGDVEGDLAADGRADGYERVTAARRVRAAVTLLIVVTLAGVTIATAIAVTLGLISLALRQAVGG